MSHVPNIRRVQQTCTHCEARFCNNYSFRYDHCVIDKCAVCRKSACSVSQTTIPQFLGLPLKTTGLPVRLYLLRAMHSLCEDCVKTITEGVGRQKYFAPSTREVFKQFVRARLVWVGVRASGFVRSVSVVSQVG